MAINGKEKKERKVLRFKLTSDLKAGFLSHESNKKAKRRETTTITRRSETVLKIREIPPKGEGEYGGKNLWES